MLEPNKPKTFILGLSTARSGTTWLHTQLTEHLPGYAAPWKKEIDSLHPSGTERKRQRLLSQDVGYELYGKPIMENPELYFKYFNTMLSSLNINYVGDLSPNNSGATEDTLKMVRDRFEKVLPVLIVREPVSRFLSSLYRMHLKGKTVEDLRGELLRKSTGNTERVFVKEMLDDANFWPQKQTMWYGNVIERATKVFGGVHVIHFNDLFYTNTDFEIKRLETELGTNFSGRVVEKVKPSKSVILSRDEIIRLRERYFMGQYEDAMRFLDIEDRWELEFERALAYHGA